MQNILITGGLGFIGFHLAKKLAENVNHNISIIDNKSYFFEKGKHNYNYYLQIRKNELNKYNIPIYQGDLCDNLSLNKQLQSIKPSIIIHFAGTSVAGVADFYPENAKNNIFDASFNLMNLSLNNNIQQFIYISSSMAYGSFPKNSDGNIVPPNEEFPCNPIDIYGSLKLSGENMIKAFHARKKLPYTIIRPSAVYGFTDCNFRVTELFASNSLLNRPLLLDNGGQHLLDFTYVEDLVSGIALAINNNVALNETFNLSYGESHSIKDLAEIIKKYNSNTIINESTAKPFRPNRGAMDVSKAKKILGYKPQYNLENGIKVYLETMKKHIHNLEYPENYYS